jgi:hypothetical protein
VTLSSENIAESTFQIFEKAIDQTAGGLPVVGGGTLYEFRLADFVADDKHSAGASRK